MKPLRRRNNRKVTFDPDTGQDRIWESQQNQDVLSNEGSVDSDVITRTFFKDCGCDGQIGGRCYECGAISCISCHGRCEKCQKPICMQHSHFFEDENGRKVRLCGICHDKTVRKQKLSKFTHFLTSFFVQTEGK